MSTLNLCSLGFEKNKTNQEIGENLVIVKKSMETYYEQNIDFQPLIQAFNKSVGASTVNKDFTIFFRDPALNSDSFDRTVMENFWTNNDKTINTSEAIDLISDFIVNLGDNAKPKNNTTPDDIYQFFYESFANPYCNFIIDFLFCGINNNNITFSSNDNEIITNNFYRFIRGGSTGDSGGTRGSGTYRLCQYCNNYFDYLKNVKQVEDIYNYVAINNNSLTNFCSCCTDLIQYQPSYYDDAKNKNNGVSVALPCQPICHKNETIKAYNGNSPLVNNGFLNGKNTNLKDEITYLRRQCLEQTICVIDKINVSIIGGNSKIQFNQICPGCQGEGSCICFIDFSDGGTIDNVNGLQNPVTFKQNCPVTLCSQQKANSQGVLETVFLPCNPYNTSDTGKNPNSNYNHDGQPSPNSSNQNRDKYIFGIQNWLVPILFIVVAIIVTISILIVNIKNINREIYLMKPNGNEIKNIIKK